MKKDVFIDEHKQPNMIEDREQFLKTIKELKLYLVEFEEDGTIKAKNYLLYCKVSSENCQLIIEIIYDKCTFLSSNGICKAWTWIGNIFLQPKSHK